MILFIYLFILKNEMPMMVVTENKYKLDDNELFELAERAEDLYPSRM